MLRKLRIPAFAAAVLAIGFALAGVASALSIDPNRNVVMLQNSSHQTSYYSFTVNYNDRGISAGVAFAKLPQNAYITGVSCHVITAFNAGTTNVLTVGTDATTTNQVINAGISNQSIDESSVTYQNVSASGALGVGITSPSDVTLYAKYAQTGNAATAGKARCIITFIPDNDM